MMHTTGNKSQRDFFKHDGIPYELLGISESNDNSIAVLRCLDGQDIKLIPEDMFRKDFQSISQGEVFDCIDNSNDDEHAEMMKALGIGYICPFCGGRLAWESDFMTSEVRGMEGGYVEVTDAEALERLSENEHEYRISGLMGETEDIGPVNEEVERTGDYAYTYMKETKYEDGKAIVSYYETNDSVIGIYTCMNCGKNYEVMDCPPSEEHNYPFFN